MANGPRDLLIADEARTAHGLPRLYRLTAKALRLILGLGSVVVVAFIFLWPSLQQQDAPRLDPKNTTVPTSNEVVAPRFDAVDSEGRPFTLTATRAIQDSSNAAIINLETPKGEMDLGPQGTLNLTAERGRFDQDAKVLDLMGAVTLTSSDGHKLVTDSITAHITPKQFESPGHVTITGPDGTLDAVRMNGDAVTGILIFQGPATLTLNQGVW